MGRKRKGLSLEQHETFGKTLKAFRCWLIRFLVSDLQYGYSKGSPVMKATYRAEKALDHLKCVMDNAACKESHPAFDRLYYGDAALEGGEVHLP